MIQQLNSLISSKYIAVLWTVIIFILCTLPSENLPANNDKMSHFIAFAGFSFFWIFHHKTPILIILIAALYGIGIEFWQVILPKSFHRGFDWYDALADAVGGIIGYGIYLIYRTIAIKCKV
ncbi:MAG: VanZ family protein [Arcicella sp.]|nr:VanZ family protein [Arcicella sp.]